MGTSVSKSSQKHKERKPNEVQIPHTHVVLKDKENDEIGYLAWFPEEILLEIVRLLPLRDLVAVSSTCSYLFRLTSDSVIWKELYHTSRWYNTDLDNSKNTSSSSTRYCCWKGRFLSRFTDTREVESRNRIIAKELNESIKKLKTEKNDAQQRSKQKLKQQMQFIDERVSNMENFVLINGCISEAYTLLVATIFALVYVWDYAYATLESVLCSESVARYVGLFDRQKHVRIHEWEMDDIEDKYQHIPELEKRLEKYVAYLPNEKQLCTIQ